MSLIGNQTFFDGKYIKSEPDIELMDKLKCGEIFMLSSANFVFMCTFCEEKIEKFHEFFDHIQHFHLLYKNEKEILLEGPNDLNCCEFEVKEEPQDTVAPAADQQKEADQSSTALLDFDDDDDVNWEETGCEIDSDSIDDSIQAVTDTKSTISKYCPTCNIQFDHFRDFKNHNIKVHPGESAFKCNICGKCFRYNSMLKKHKPIHGNDRRYKCDQCERGFNKKSNLDVHIRRQHTGEKPHKCELCDKKFHTASDVKVHIRYHTGDMPYACEFCDKKFPSSWSKLKHVKTHSDQKSRSFICDICGKGYNRSYDLKTHKNTHAESKLFKCDICGMAYSWQRSLNKHRKTHQE